MKMSLTKMLQIEAAAALTFCVIFRIYKGKRKVHMYALKK